MQLIELENQIEKTPFNVDIVCHTAKKSVRPDKECRLKLRYILYCSVELLFKIEVDGGSYSKIHKLHRKDVESK